MPLIATPSAPVKSRRASLSSSRATLARCACAGGRPNSGMLHLAPKWSGLVFRCCGCGTLVLDRDFAGSCDVVLQFGAGMGEALPGHANARIIVFWRDDCRRSLTTRRPRLASTATRRRRSSRWTSSRARSWRMCAPRATTCTRPTVSVAGQSSI